MAENILSAEKTFADAAILKIEVATTGPQGGDSGHGARTMIRLTDLASSDMDCRVERDGGRILIVADGDAEGRNLTSALEFAAQQLRRHWEWECDASEAQLNSLRDAMSDSHRALRLAIQKGDVVQIETAMDRQRADFQRFKSTLDAN